MINYNNNSIIANNFSLKLSKFVNFITFDKNFYCIYIYILLMNKYKPLYKKN